MCEQFGQAAIEQLVSSEARADADSWLKVLRDCLTAAGQLDGTQPTKRHATRAGSFA